MERQPQLKKTEDNKGEYGARRHLATGVMLAAGVGSTLGGAYTTAHALENYNNAWKHAGMADVYEAQGDAVNAQTHNKAAHTKLDNSLLQGGLAAGELLAGAAIASAGLRRLDRDNEPHPQAPRATSVPRDLPRQ